MAASSMIFQVKCNGQRPPVSPCFDHLETTLSSVFKPFTKRFEQLRLQINIPDIVKNSSAKFLNAIVDSVFDFVDMPLLPSQGNFSPINELRAAVNVTDIEGKIPDGCPEGVYIRNGSNPLYGGLKSTKSMLGKTASIWVEGEGMVHAMYFNRESDGRWNIVYNNRHVETDTFLWEKQRNKPALLPVAQGDSLAIFTGALLNLLRCGQPYKNTSNTSVFEHGGKIFTISESHQPQEIDISTLQTKSISGVSEAWNRSCTSHPKKVPGTGELVITGREATKPYYELGVISADGRELLHKMDLKLDRCPFTHDLGVTERYVVFMDFPLTIDLNRVLKGGQFIDYNKEEYARIGVIPRFGNAESIRWFNVESNCTFHLFNCFEDGDDVVVRGCQASGSVLKALPLKNFERLAKKLATIESSNDEEESFKKIMKDEELFTRCYEWRNKYGYAQIVDSAEESELPKFSGVAKLFFEEWDDEKKLINIKCHEFEHKTYVSGIIFVPREQGDDEDDGWIVSFVHNEETNISQVHIIDAKKFCEGPVAVITLPYRVPYGFHSAFVHAN